MVTQAALLLSIFPPDVRGFAKYLVHKGISEHGDVTTSSRFISSGAGNKIRSWEQN